MDRAQDVKDNCITVRGPDFEGMECNHVGFLDRYDWGYICGNCGSTFQFRQVQVEIDGQPPVGI